MNGILSKSTKTWTDPFGATRSQFPTGSIVENDRGFPDFIVTFSEPSSSLGFEVISVRSYTSAMMRLRDTAYRAYYEVSEGNMSGLTLVVVVEDPELADQVYSITRGDRMPDSEGVSFIIGTLEHESDRSFEFRPIYGAND